MLLLRDEVLTKRRREMVGLCRSLVVSARGYGRRCLLWRMTSRVIDCGYRFVMP